MSSASESAPSIPAASAGFWLIEPRQHGVLDRARELWSYRYLWWYFAAQTLTSMYRGTALGWVWLVMRVAGPVGLNALIFGGVLGQASKSGKIPYFLFFLCGMTTWIMFERSLLFITRSIERNRRIITKIYFPRLILPFSSVAPALLYLAIIVIVMIGTVVYFYDRDGIWYITLQPRLLVAAVMIVLSLVFATAVGLFTSVLQARFRDIRYGLRYFMPFWMFLTPIIYPLSSIPEKYRWLAAINPMAPIVEAFKWATLGEGTFSPAGMMRSVALIALTMFVGMWFFNRAEAASVDRL
jgi:lipopolysaccharide transport system permease protein